MKKIKLPNPIVLVVGSIGAFWIADIINPGFNPVGVMILFLIPVLVADFLYPQQELEQLWEEARIQSTPVEAAIAQEPVSGDLVDEETESSV